MKIWYNIKIITNSYTDFFGPNDIKAAEFVLHNNYNIKIIYYGRDLLSRILQFF